MKKLFGFFSATGLLYFFFLGAPVAVTSCKKEIIRDTIIITDTLVITDSTCDLKDGLVAWYNFNGGSLKDSSGNGNHIISNNAVATPDRNGKANNAYMFNGVNNFMKVNNSPSLNPQGKISLFAIVKVNQFYTGACHSNQIVKKGFSDQSDGIYGLRISTFQPDCNAVTDITKEKINGYYGNTQFSSSGVADTDFATTGKWYSICYTYDGVQAKLYVDGVLKNTTVKTASFTPNSEGLYIGSTPNPQYPYWFNGVIDEVRVYNRDLCDCEVKLLNKLKN